LRRCELRGTQLCIVDPATSATVECVAYPMQDLGTVPTGPPFMPSHTECLFSAKYGLYKLANGAINKVAPDPAWSTQQQGFANVELFRGQTSRDVIAVGFLVTVWRLQ
jgi:hypothetical protein